VEVFGISNVFTNERANDFNQTTTRKKKAACKMESKGDQEIGLIFEHARSGASMSTSNAWVRISPSISRNWYNLSL